MKTSARLLTALLLSAVPALAQPGERYPVAAGNTWSISPADCGIDAIWDDGVAVNITAHDDHHDFGLYDARLKGVADGKVVPVRFAAGGVAIAGEGYQALGYRDADNTGYVSNVDDALLDRIAAANSVQVHRGKTLLADLNLTGLTEALAVMRECEAAQPQAPSADAGSDGMTDGMR